MYCSIACFKIVFQNKGLEASGLISVLACRGVLRKSY